jgi:hypothetical protein
MLEFSPEHQLTPEQWLSFGMSQVAYLKVGVFGYMIYTADGHPLEIADTMEAAFDVVADNGLHFVRVH